MRSLVRICRSCGSAASGMTVLAFVAACAAPSHPVELPAPRPAPGTVKPPSFPDRCGPEFEVMVGHNIGEFTLPRGLPHRIAQPGAALMENYNPARLNVFVDDKGWVQKVECW